MKCKICGGEQLTVDYYGKIRGGGVGTLSKENYTIWRCNKCQTLWHETFEYDESYYTSGEYRTSIDGNSDIENYYKIYDKLVLNRLEWMGTDLFRDKFVADIGCGGGSLLDYLSVVSRLTLGIEPSELQRAELKKKGHIAVDYIENAALEFKGQADIITCFDVIEHIQLPHDFVRGMYTLANDGAKVICGTPTDYPLLRNLIGKKFEEFMFDIQHPWVLSEEGLRILFEQAGFKNIRVERKQQYGLGNLISWLIGNGPKGDIKLKFITDTLDKVYKEEIVKNTGGEYLLLFAEK